MIEIFSYRNICTLGSNPPGGVYLNHTTILRAAVSSPMLMDLISAPGFRSSSYSFHDATRDQCY